MIKDRAGIAVLPTVIIVAAIIMELAIAAVLISNSFTGSAFNARLATEALAVAEAGAEDGILKVIRYCSIGSVGDTECEGGELNDCDLITGESSINNEVPYKITLGSRTACVLIKDDGSAGNKIIISGANISERIKRVEVKLSIDQTTGKTEVKSFKECYNYTISSRTCS